MKRAVVLAAVAVFSGVGLLAAEVSLAAGGIEILGLADAVVGGKPLKAEAAAKTLQGRVWSQWADNPDGELLFGVQYWNTGEPGSGTPAGRTSTTFDVKPPDPLFSCCAWGFTGGSEKNSTYSGWYNSAATVRLAVKDKALMDQIIKASQELIAMEITLDGRTITGFKVIKAD